MKTTVEIADDLLAAAQRVADSRGVTVQALVEEGLRQVVEAARERPRFHLRDASFGGSGIDPAFEDGNWERIHAAAFDLPTNQDGD